MIRGFDESFIQFIHSLTTHPTDFMEHSLRIYKQRLCSGQEKKLGLNEK